MQIHVPETIEHYEPTLRLFFDLMVFKLNLNRHKDDASEGYHPIDMFNLLDGEQKELRDALIRESQGDVMFEAVDVANMAFLTSLYAGRLTKDEFENGRVNGAAK